MPNTDKALKDVLPVEALNEAWTIMSNGMRAGEGYEIVRARLHTAVATPINVAKVSHATGEAFTPKKLLDWLFDAFFKAMAAKILALSLKQAAQDQRATHQAPRYYV